jgi:hypothetical protein
LEKLEYMEALIAAQETRLRHVLWELDRRRRAVIDLEVILADLEQAEASPPPQVAGAQGASK